MKVEWDKEYEHKRNTTVYAEELDAIKKVLTGEHQSVCFTYEFDELVLNAVTTLRRIAKELKLPVKFMKRKLSIYVTKEDAK